MHEGPAQGPPAPGRAAEQEEGGQAQGDRYDGLAQVGLVPVLVQAHAAAGQVAVDQAGIGGEVRKARLGGCVAGQVGKKGGHGRPGLARLRVDRAVAIAAPITDPAPLAAAAHGHRHGLPAGCLHLAEGRAGGDVGHGGQQRRGVALGKGAQQHGAGREGFTGGEGVGEEVGRHGSARENEERDWHLWRRTHSTPQGRPARNGFSQSGSAKEAIGRAARWCRE